MMNSKEIGYLWAIILFVISLVVIFWDYFRAKKLIRRFKGQGQESGTFSKLMPESSCVVQLSETGVSSTNPNGRIDTVEWHDLNSVEIVTTDKGPFFPDVFWLLNGSRTKCVIPQGATGETELLNRLQKLPGFRNEALIKAMQSTDNARFLCWQRASLDDVAPI
jgi:hypothetical protein